MSFNYIYNLVARCCIILVFQLSLMLRKPIKKIRIVHVFKSLGA
ncbi:hypothetical protein Zm00014a_039999 [Zea mays]|uniref:Uncharacterized protein n=1 Tax=Zea mays TaxID=4577 RepID=A0A3L6ES02_MAIZE|nr:hypothetical protein Zm00014a_039999 [Zea mays]